MLVTGAAGGLGVELARLFHERDWRVLAVYRPPPAGTPLPTDFPADVVTIPVDALDAAGPSQLLFHLDHLAVQRLDLVVHNAAVGWFGPPWNQPEDSLRRLLEIDLWSPIALTHALLPRMANGRGRFVFIGSVAAVLPTPFFAAYSAAKAGLDGFVRSLRLETRGVVDVQIIHPGPIRTMLHERSGADRDALGWKRFPTARTVARQVVDAVGRRRRVVSPGVVPSLLFRGGRLAPLLFARAMERRAAAAAPPLLAHRTGDAPRHVVVTGFADGIGRAVATA
ncbi:MAG: SDR family NAD(P)-dependent oxidoreductase, partial [Planctomycetia bacterium]